MTSHKPPKAPKIGDHAIVGDSRTAALIARDGTVDWLCLPDFSSASVFAAILDSGRGGQFVLRPEGDFEVTRRYVDGILETEFTTASGKARVRDCMTIIDGVHPMRPMRELLRIVEGLEGEVAFVTSIDLRPEYGQRNVVPRSFGTLGWRWCWKGEIAVLRSDCNFAAEGHRLSGALTTAPGSRHTTSLSYCRNDVALFVPLGHEAAARLQQTRQWWQNWLSRSSYEGRHREAVRTSAMVLQLLTFSPSGAIIAAPSTSLPETPGGQRNWDYRYCWLRDAGLTARAFVGLGYVAEAHAYSNWLLHATRLTRPQLRVLYDVYGRNNMQERELAHFSGHAQSRPVRVGNNAYRQLQLDVYGQTVLAADSVAGAGGRLDGADSRMLRDFGKAVCTCWREPDCGIWEIRSAPRHFTLSKVMCWVALDRLLAMDGAGIVALGSLRREFSAVREEIRGAIETRGFNAALGCYTSAFDGDKVDASLLLLACVGFHAADDPRMRATYQRIQDSLTRGGLLQRYAPGFDGDRSPEGAFGICNFWAVETLARRGEVDAAAEMFDRVLYYANDLGLFGEEIDPVSGDALGNFPQAFTHVGLINAALAIADAERRAQT